MYEGVLRINLLHIMLPRDKNKRRNY